MFLCLDFGNVTQVYLLIWTVNCRDSFVLIYKVYSKNNCTFRMSIAHSGVQLGWEGQSFIGYRTDGLE